VPPVPPAPAPGLREQVGATRGSAKRLIGAHVELGKAEFADIADELKRAAILAGIAVAAGIAAALLLSVGLPLFLGEWIFGSLGWGLLHGLLFLLAIAIAGALLAVHVSGARIGTSFLVGAGLGVLVAIVLGLALTNRGWAIVGDRIVPLASADIRPLAAALLALPVVAALLFGVLSFAQTLTSDDARNDVHPPAFGGRVAASLPAALYVGWLAAFAFSYSTNRPMFDWSIVGVAVGALIAAAIVLAIVSAWRPGYALVTGLSLGVVIGVALAPLSAVAFGGRVSAAIGVTIGLATWSTLMGIEVARRGIDTDDLKERFMPRRTIDMTKETIEWARARMPLSRRS
jgi:MFS family permease